MVTFDPGIRWVTARGLARKQPQPTIITKARWTLTGIRCETQGHRSDFHGISNKVSLFHASMQPSCWVKRRPSWGSSCFSGQPIGVRAYLLTRLKKAACAQNVGEKRAEPRRAPPPGKDPRPGQRDRTATMPPWNPQHCTPASPARIEVRTRQPMA